MRASFSCGEAAGWGGRRQPPAPPAEVGEGVAQRTRGGAHLGHADCGRNLLERGAHNEDGGVVVEEDSEGQAEGGGEAAALGRGEPGHELAQADGAAGALDDSDQAAEEEAEDEHGRMPVPIVEHLGKVGVKGAQQGHQGVVSRDEERSQPDAEDEGNVHLLQPHRGSDGERGRSQRQPPRHGV